MKVPKASVDEYDFAELAKDEIGLSGKVSGVKAVTIAEGVY